MFSSVSVQKHNNQTKEIPDQVFLLLDYGAIHKRRPQFRGERGCEKKKTRADRERGGFINMPTSFSEISISSKFLFLLYHFAGGDLSSS